MRAIYLSVFIVSLSGYVLANLRAPMWFPEAPSSFLSKVSSDNTAQNLEVQKERLTMDCSYTSCDVDAVYYIAAKQSERLQFEFILPVDVSVVTNINGLSSVATVSMIPYSISDRFNDNSSAKAYKAVFTGRLNAGDNFIQINYEQKLGLFESDYGYFTHSRFTEKFTYALGPLKEWQLAPDFSLDITLSTPKQRPDRDGWSLFKKRSISCQLDNSQQIKKGDKIIYYSRLDKKFPDELVCYMGDTDLLGRR